MPAPLTSMEIFQKLLHEKYEISKETIFLMELKGVRGATEFMLCHDGAMGTAIKEQDFPGIANEVKYLLVAICGIGAADLDAKETNALQRCAHIMPELMSLQFGREDDVHFAQ